MRKECPECKGSGWRPVEKDGLRAVERCVCQNRQPDEASWMERARIPRGFRRCDFSNFDPTHAPIESRNNLKKALIMARSFAKEYPLEKKGLLFLGNPGVGKTHLAVSILRQLMLTKGVDCLFCSYPELLQQMLDSYDSLSQKPSSEIVQPVLDAEVLLIDDLGARRVSDWVEDTLTYIISFRYNEKKATLFTSNLSDTAEESQIKGPGGKLRLADTLTDRIGLRVRSRLHEMCRTVEILSVDYRAEVQAHGSWSD